MDCSLPGSSVHGILQARILDWVAMPSSRGSSLPRDQTLSLSFPALAGRFFTTRATWEALYTEYIMRNAKLGESQAGIKIAGRNINNLKYIDNTILNGRKWRETKRLLVEHERGEWKSWLKTQHSKKIMGSDPMTSWRIDGEKVETDRFLFSWAPESLQTVTVAMKLKDPCSLIEKLWQT